MSSPLVSAMTVVILALWATVVSQGLPWAESLWDPVSLWLSAVTKEAAPLSAPFFTACQGGNRPQQSRPLCERTGKASLLPEGPSPWRQCNATARLSPETTGLRARVGGDLVSQSACTAAQGDGQQSSLSGVSFSPCPPLSLNPSTLDVFNCPNKEVPWTGLVGYIVFSSVGPLI